MHDIDLKKIVSLKNTWWSKKNLLKYFSMQRGPLGASQGIREIPVFRYLFGHSTNCQASLEKCDP